MNILLCAKSRPGMIACKPHSHTDWEIILQTKGTVKSKIGNTVYTINKGDILVIPPSTVHDGNSEEEYQDIYFLADSLDFFSPVITHDFDGSVAVLINLLHKVMTEKENNYKQISVNISETICQFIKKHNKQSRDYPFVNDLKNIIYKNISNSDFSLSEQIKELGFNSDYLRRCFKKELGKTPLEYLTDLRLSQSKVLLTQDKFVSIENVALNCGFNDAFYFSVCFKKHNGISPLQYRKAKKS